LKIAATRTLSPQPIDNKWLMEILQHLVIFGIGHALFAIEEIEGKKWK